jgi:hypothetical protein
MALPIKDTPLLTGKDADKFWKRASECEMGLHKVPEQEIKKMKENAAKIEKLVKFK